MLKLYGGGRSRWVRPLWMLRELAVPFEAVTMDRPGGALDGEEFRALNPAGKIPVLVDDGRPICESGAILLYLGDKYHERGLVPPPGSHARGVHDQWMFTVATELEQPLWRIHKHVHRGQGDEAAAEVARREFAEVAPLFESLLGGHPFLLGETFYAVDIMLAHLLTWQVTEPLLAPYVGLRAYRERTTARPAFPSYLYG